MQASAVAQLEEAATKQAELEARLAVRESKLTELTTQAESASKAAAAEAARLKAEAAKQLTAASKAAEQEADRVAGKTAQQLGKIKGEMRELEVKLAEAEKAHKVGGLGEGWFGGDGNMQRG